MAELDYGTKWTLHVLMKAHKAGPGKDTGKSLFRTQIEKATLAAGKQDLRDAIKDTLKNRFNQTIDMAALPVALPIDFTAPQLRATLQMGDGEYDPASGPCEGMSPEAATGNFFDHEKTLVEALLKIKRPTPAAAPEFFHALRAPDTETASPTKDTTD